MKNKTVIIAGMHRSGTSLLANLLNQLGINVGGELVAADCNNKEGYYEDLNFLNINQKILASLGDSQEEGHLDWGWLENRELDFSLAKNFSSDANNLVAKKTDSTWGWKDPRNSVLLDFWKSIIPDAKFIFTYRYPWQVADSMKRLGAPIFIDNPDYAYKIWDYYNNKIINFYLSNQKNSLLLSTHAIQTNPILLNKLLKEKLEIDTKEINLDQVIKKDLFKSAIDDDIITQTKLKYPYVIKTLEKLEKISDLKSPQLLFPDSIINRIKNMLFG